MDALHIEQLRGAIIHRASRNLALRRAPLGYTSDVTEYGPATTMPDYTTAELLYGLMYQPLVDADEADIDLTTLVTADDVLRAYNKTESADLSADGVEDVTNAITMACAWVRAYLAGGAGISMGASV